MSSITFAFDDEGRAHAIREGKVLTSADSLEELEAKLAAPMNQPAGGALPTSFADFGIYQNAQGGLQTTPPQGGAINHRGTPFNGEFETPSFLNAQGQPQSTTPQGAQINHRGVPEQSTTITPDAAPAQTKSAPVDKAPSNPYANAGEYLQMGSTGDAVKALQNKLGIEADGVFGQDTQNAVKEYQQKQQANNPNFAVDGVVGNQTANSLLGNQGEFDAGAMNFGKGSSTHNPREINLGKPSKIALQMNAPGGGAAPENDLDQVPQNLLDQWKKAPAEEKAFQDNQSLVHGLGDVHRNLEIGTQGEDVANLQKALGIKSDGIFGEQTQKALTDYQSQHNLNADGIYGLQTRDKMQKLLQGSGGERPAQNDMGNRQDVPSIAPGNITSATHVITPNGLKGKILGKTKDLWSDTVTVRFENGRIVQFPVSDGMKFAHEDERPMSLTASLVARLEQIVPGDRDSLLARIDVLKDIKREAQTKITTAEPSYEDERKLDNIIVEANAELAEIVDALEHIASETTEPYSPPMTQVVEQASLGSHTGSWLDDTFSEMVHEANGTDYDKLMDEGPEAFVAELDAPVLADSGVTREMASNYIRSKTAGANPEARNAFEKAWLDRVESLRRSELVSRKTKAKKEAAAQEDISHLPDDVLFG